jgi:hypothetical protein
MQRWTLTTVVLVVVAAAVWWWPTDRRRINAAAQELAETVSVPASEPDLARVTRAARLSRLLTPEFQLVDPGGRAVVDGRDSAIGFATRLRPPRGLQVSVADLDLVIDAGSRTARARTTVTMREPGPDGSTASVESRAVLLDWAKGDAWALSRLTVAADEGSGLGVPGSGLQTPGSR